MSNTNEPRKRYINTRPRWSACSSSGRARPRSEPGRGSISSSSARPGRAARRRWRIGTIARRIPSRRTRNPVGILALELLHGLVETEHEPLPRRDGRRDRTGNTRLRLVRFRIVVSPRAAAPLRRQTLAHGDARARQERGHRRCLRLHRDEVELLARHRDRERQQRRHQRQRRLVQRHELSHCILRTHVAIGRGDRVRSRCPGSAPPARPTRGPPSPRRTAPGRRSTPRRPAPSGRAGSARSRRTSDPDRPAHPRTATARHRRRCRPPGLRSRCRRRTRMRHPDRRRRKRSCWSSDPSPRNPEISVKSFDPALTVTRSVWPLKLPTKVGPGSVPTAKRVGVRCH